MFLLASLWLLSSQKKVFMNKLDEFIDELERVEKFAKENKRNATNIEENEDSAGTRGLGLKEMIEEGEKGKVKLA